MCFELKLSKILIEWAKLFTNIPTNHNETLSVIQGDRYNSINIEVDSSFQNTATCIHQDSIKMSSACLVEPTICVWYISTDNIWNAQHAQMPEKQNHWLRKEQGTYVSSLLHKVTKGQMWLRHWTQKMQTMFLWAICFGSSHLAQHGDENI